MSYVLSVLQGGEAGSGSTEGGGQMSFVTGAKTVRD